MWTHTSGETSADRPKRIRLSDFTTRTSEAVTDELLADAGWTFVEPEIILPTPTEPVIETPVVVVTEQVEMMVSGTM
jgi:hypothetical protein